MSDPGHAERYVRTDAVCHATNAYLGVIDALPPGPLVTLPERPEVLAANADVADDGSDVDE